MTTKRVRRQLPVLGDTFCASGPVLEQLEPRGHSDDHAVFAVGDELVIRPGSPNPLQPYPGAWGPDLSARNRFPLPDRPGEYGTREEFDASPKFMAQFVHWPDRVDLVLQGRYFELPPVHFEGIFTLVCNFMCPHCSRRVTRTEWVEGGTWDNNTPAEKRNTMEAAGLRRMLDQAATLMTDGQMGIIWGGGDPTANPYTYEGMLYARELGISSSFLTNGVFLEVDRTLEPDPILIRISLNCGTEENYVKFHGYPKEWDYFDRVKHKMREIARRKLELGARTLIGISLIVDERNLDDLVEAAHEVRRVQEDSGGGIDYCIVRPVMNYASFYRPWAQLTHDTKSRAQALVEDDGEVGQILSNVGVPLVAIKDSFEDPPGDEADFFRRSTDCLAYGIASEIRHNGDVQLCSDSYGDPEYTIGNLYNDSLEAIWTSERRRSTLAQINEKRCFRTTCPHNSRGHHYNRLFHRIEAMRTEGRIDDVRQWISDLQEVTEPLGHSFFL
jgi:radical SAM protein with 4Fe4S-binding SPASM domain